MPLNPSWMELGLADRVQSQTHFMFSLPWSCLSSSHSPITQGSPAAAPTASLCCCRTIFGKTLRLNLFASLLLTVYCKTFFLPTPRETESRSKPFYSLQKTALLYFMVTEPQINLNWYNSALFFFFHFLFSYFSFHNPQFCSKSYSLCFPKDKTSI